MSTFTVRIEGDELLLEDAWWPARLFIDPDLMERIERNETTHTTYDGEQIRFDFANGWAVYRAIGPSLTHRVYEFDCVSCTRDLDR